MNKIYLGSSGLLKKELALDEARHLLNTDKVFTHPDFYLMEPDCGKHSVCAVEKLVDFLSVSANEAEYKVVIIEKCHLATVEFQQAILKLLEDSTASFLLTAEERLLDTIHSRCTTVSIREWSDAEMNQWIVSQGLSQNPVARELSGGRPGIYRQVLSLEGLLKNAEVLKKGICEGALGASIVSIGALSESFYETVGKEQSLLLIRFVERTLTAGLNGSKSIDRDLDAIELCALEREKMRNRSYGKTESFRFWRALSSLN